jgi:type III restriction enzyme
MEDRDEHGQPTGQELLYLVRETRGTLDRDDWRPDQRRKVMCAERHFRELGVEYKVVTSARELR